MYDNIPPYSLLREACCAAKRRKRVARILNLILEIDDSLKIFEVAHSNCVSGGERYPGDISCIIKRRDSTLLAVTSRKMHSIAKRLYRPLLVQSTNAVPKPQLLARSSVRFFSGNAVKPARPDYYSVLGITYDATTEQVKAAFREQGMLLLFVLRYCTASPKCHDLITPLYIPICLFYILSTPLFLTCLYFLFFSKIASP